MVPYRTVHLLSLSLSLSLSPFFRSFAHNGIAIIIGTWPIWKSGLDWRGRGGSEEQSPLRVRLRLLGRGLLC